MTGTGAADVIMALVKARGSAASICPTEAARAMADRLGAAGDHEAWRQFLPQVRRTAVDLARSGAIDILRKGRPIAPEAVHGVIRLRLRETTEESG